MRTSLHENIHVIAKFYEEAFDSVKWSKCSLVFSASSRPHRFVIAGIVLRFLAKILVYLITL